MQPIALTKSLTASSSNMLGSFSSAGTTLYTTGSSASIGTSSGAIATALDTPRRNSQRRMIERRAKRRGLTFFAP